MQTPGVGTGTGRCIGFALRATFLPLSRATDYRTGRSGLLGPVLSVILFAIIVDTVVNLVVLTAADFRTYCSGSGTYSGPLQTTTRLGC